MIIGLIFKLHMPAQWFEMDSLSPHNWFLVYLLAIGAHQVIRYTSAINKNWLGGFMKLLKKNLWHHLKPTDQIPFSSKIA
jgi:hypothetical protein